MFAEMLEPCCNHVHAHPARDPVHPGRSPTLKPHVPGAAWEGCPRVLFTTSTKDDRVHPGHARKLLGKMIDLKMPALSYENIEGGHGGAADNKQRAFMSTLIYSFLAKTLRDGEIQPAASATKVPLRARIDPRAVTMAAGAVLLGWLAVVERGRR